MAPICCGRINDIDVDVMRDSGSKSCVVRTDLVREKQKTGTTSLCMLIDGTVRRYPTAIIELDTPYLSGGVQALCMDDPVNDVIIEMYQERKTVQTRAKSEKANQKKKELKVFHVPGREVTTEELIELQKADETVENIGTCQSSPVTLTKRCHSLRRKESYTGPTVTNAEMRVDYS